MTRFGCATHTDYMEWLKLIPAEAGWPAAVIAVAAVVRWYLRERLSIAADLASRSRINSELDAVREAVGACAVRVIRTHNGSGLPTPDKPLYLSIVHESASAAHQRIERAQNVLLDGPASVWLYEVFADSRVVRKTGAMRGVLRETWETHGVALTDAWRLGLGSKAAFFLVIQYDHVPTDTAAHRDRLRAAADALRTAIGVRHDRPSRVVGWLARK